MAEIETKCQCCGKPVAVLEPSRWGYKVKGKNGLIYYCSWKCLRADEKRIEQAQKEKQDARKVKQQEKIRNDRLEVLKGMMKAVSEGKNAYDYLKSMGYADPKDTLRRLRITAKEEAPKIYRKMDKLGLLDLRKGHSGKGVDKMSKHKLTREQKEKAVELALSGGDYLAHLKECGSKNPSAAWWYIRKTLEKSDPTLLAKVMKKTGEVETLKTPGGDIHFPLTVEKVEKTEDGVLVTARQPEKTEGGPIVEKADKLPPERTIQEITEVYDVGPAFRQEDVGQKSVKMDMGMIPQQDKQAEKFAARLQEGIDILAEAAEKVKFPEIMDRLKTFGDSVADFRVTAINGEFGEYNVTKNPHWFEFDSLDNKTRISMRQEDMGAFINELIRAANFLGVSV